MPTAVKAFNVKIASPGEAAMEMIIAREVIWEWNSEHAMERKQVLLPLYREEHTGTLSDLMVAFYCASAVKSKSPTRESISYEIEHHLQEGAPVLIYFSEARVDFAESGDEPEEELIHLRQKYGSRAIVGTYGDEKELRAQFTRDLEAIVHSRFKVDDAASIEVPVITVPPVGAPTLSECAQTLLMEACEDFEGYIGRSKVGVYLKIQANGKQLVDQNDSAAAAMWENAFQELLCGAYIHDAGYNGQLFQISAKGFAFLKSIGKTPVGYISEMGNM
jgi:hypothetical protein